MECSKCQESATMKQGNQHLCDKHYRFGQMRVSAKRNGKVVPTNEELEQMVSPSMICPDCFRRMNWRSKDGRDTVASLQHYRSGELAVVCLSCNTRHASMAGDSYCNMPKDHKKCPSCLSIVPLSEFSKDNNRQGVMKKKGICKACSNKKVNDWRKENRDEYNEYQRSYRAKRKAKIDTDTRND